MPSTWIVETIDVFEDCHLGVSAHLPRPSPDQLSLDRLEERLDGGVVIAVALAAHRYMEAVLTQELLIIVGAISAAAIRMMDAALGRLAERHGHL